MEDHMIDLPLDILEEIFACLPPVECIPLKLVCKSWYSILTSPNFVKLHYRRMIESSNIHSMIMLEDYEFDGSNFYICQTSLRDFNPLYIPRDCSKFIGVAHGIICMISDDNGSLFLFNPFSKRSRYIVTPDLRGPFSYGFGFDANIENFKVFVLYKNAADDLSSGLLVRIINEDEGKWSDLIPVTRDFSPDILCSGFWLEPVLYWFVYSVDELTRFLFSCDVCHHTQQLIALPFGSQHDGSLTDLWGGLCYLSNGETGLTCYYLSQEIWEPKFCLNHHLFQLNSPIQIVPIMELFENGKPQLLLNIIEESSGYTLRSLIYCGAKESYSKVLFPPNFQGYIIYVGKFLPSLYSPDPRAQTCGAAEDSLAEFVNPRGSVKDGIALNIIEEDQEC